MIGNIVHQKRVQNVSLLCINVNHIRIRWSMINKLLNLPYEKRIEFMERECVKGTPKCKNFIPEKCVACWEQVFEKEFNKCL